MQYALNNLKYTLLGCKFMLPFILSNDQNNEKPVQLLKLRLTHWRIKEPSTEHTKPYLVKYLLISFVYPLYGEVETTVLNLPEQ